jgi:hypothetical protein
MDETTFNNILKMSDTVLKWIGEWRNNELKNSFENVIPPEF